MSMNTLEELEFLLELQDQSIGTSSHDDVEVYCHMFEKAGDKADGLKAEVKINMRRIDFKKTGSYISEMFYEAKMPDAVNEAIIAVFKKAIGDKVIQLRGKAREVLGIPEERHEEGAGQEYNTPGEGGTGNHEVNN